MAKKTRKQKQRAAARRTSATPPRPRPQEPALDEGWGTAQESAVATATSEPVTAQTLPQPDDSAPVRRRIERISPAAAQRPARPGRPPANAAAMFRPLETDDAAIPFDRVPYVPSDLRRVAVMAACMVALIIIAAVIVTHVVT